MIDSEVTIIARYLNKPNDEALRIQVEAYRKASAVNEAYFLALEKIWKLSSSSGRLEGVDQERATENLRTLLSVGSVKRFILPLWLKGAAAILVFGLIYWLYIQQSGITFTTKSTLANQIDSVKLSDGSVIILAENTEIKYPIKFDGSTRDIYLVNGKAFFKVSKDPSRPFKVVINKSSVSVLGTSFNIINSPNKIDLDVKTGKVLFMPFKGSTGLVLTKGQAVTYDIEKSQLIAKKSQNADSWLTKELSFVDTPLEEVCVQLSKYFDVKIKLENNKKVVKKFNATFKNEDLDGVLNLIKETYDIKVNRQTDQIILTTTY